ncbi:hypothetical protein [Planctomyces sp. SH-PL62]|uniref:hypothetical protein n=1 Tax=Planctomyces sp. SH-PL62 TaxID=1636152 RepID=UPI00078D6DDB|nr:hypothetical protein [Planctomyces sp. SH-PL62]AMV38584.1 hypothetical protein VT85_14195 [Planctomyces sp. SH-PL62]
MMPLEARPERASATGFFPRWLARRICTSNPFYILSAWMVCMGLRVSFGAHADASQTWALFGGMAGYTLLLAVTACLLVRRVGVWDDVRTIMLLVVLLILATSVTFDDVFTRDPVRGAACYLLGLLFAVAVSEGLLRGTRLALPALFRVPYHLTLALFFLYPVALAPLLDQPESEALQWALFGFSPAAGLIALTLLPAVRRGRRYVADNGSPWRWAWYPWTLFGLLAFGVVARSAMLCWSMHHAGKAYGAEPYIFGGYFLAPFLLAVAAVLMEIGVVERRSGVKLVALALPAIATVLAAIGHRPELAYQEFLGRFEGRLGGSPLHLTLAISGLFYAVAALRRVPLAIEALTVALAALAFVATETRGLDGLAALRPLPLLAIAALQTAIGLRDRSSWRCLIGAASLTAVIVAPSGVGIPLTGWREPAAFHLIMAASLVVGAVFDDAFARLARGLGVAMAVLSCLVATIGSIEAPAGIAPWAVAAYPPAVGLALCGYGLIVRDPTPLWAAALVAASWLAAGGWRGYDALRSHIPGLDYIVIGLAFFVAAVLTSLAKAGVPLRRGTWTGGKPRDVLG